MNTIAETIATEAATRNAGTQLIVNTAGDILDIVQTGTWYANAQDVPAGAAGRIDCGTGLTASDAQDILDAIAAHPGDRDAQDAHSFGYCGC